MTVPSAWPGNVGSAADWGQATTAQADGDPAPYPHGKALGGSSAINAMAHVRGHRSCYDGWAATGLAGWGFADLLPYFRRSERADGRDPALRGTEGPVRVAPVPAGERHPVASALAEALVAAGYPATEDLSGAHPEGVAWPDLAISGGERVSAADAYLRPAMSRQNLTVLTDCLVTRLDIRDGRCAGVRYARDGQDARAWAGREVIVCGGAIGAPQLLLLSGVGPADQLRALGIEPVADLPGVGENLHDHPLGMLSYAAPDELPASRYNHGEMYAALRSDTAGDAPDLHLFPILLPLAPAGCQPPRAGYVLASGVMIPDSRGCLRLASADPVSAPLIDPGFLREQRDTDRIEQGLRLIREAAARTGLAAAGHAELWPGPDVRSGADLRAYIRRTVGSYYHPAGTCRMGTDAGSVTDPRLRVRGVAGLRVADASVLPAIPNAHLNATVLAIAERAAELISDPAAGVPLRTDRHSS